MTSFETGCWCCATMTWSCTNCSVRRRVYRSRHIGCHHWGDHVNSGSQIVPPWPPSAAVRSLLDKTMTSYNNRWHDKIWVSELCEWVVGLVTSLWSLRGRVAEEWPPIEAPHKADSLRFEAWPRKFVTQCSTHCHIGEYGSDVIWSINYKIYMTRSDVPRNIYFDQNCAFFYGERVCCSIHLWTTAPWFWFSKWQRQERWLISVKYVTPTWHTNPRHAHVPVTSSLGDGQLGIIINTAPRQ